MVEKSLRAILVGDATVNAFFGGRVYYQTAPAKRDVPYAILERVGTSHAEDTTNSCGISQATIGVDVASRSYYEARQAMDAIRQLFAFTNKTDGGSGGPTVHRIKVAEDSDAYQSANDASETPVHFIGMDFDVWFSVDVRSS